ncbi:hypothetical protein Vretimale_7415 [Volvox reticuliferus]|uniref:DAGKc domain-containing protein n=1 Tax=Volvox reticuliferus TaxID=1737510 RepID=A0A8J4LMR5_9CHLO|nr:hypothetical protein Vretimale_7415 [Volvox reticuliferus]
MPMGTSNDFAAVTGIPQDLESALRLCCRPDNLKQLDVGLLNGEVFMNTATLGASSELGSETSHEAKKLLGPAAYLVKGIARLAGYAAMPVKMRFPAPLESQQPHQKVAKEAAVGAASEGTADAAAAAAGAAATGTASEHQQQPPQPSTDQPHAVRSFSSLSGGRKNQVKGWLSSSWKKTVEVHEEVLNLTAGNSRQVASMLQACPDALLDDGLLDVTYVTGGAVESATALVGEILARGLDGAQPDNVRILRVPWIEVTLEAQDPDLTWPGNRDGEAVPPARFFWRRFPGALRCTCRKRAESF